MVLLSACTNLCLAHPTTCVKHIPAAEVAKHESAQSFWPVVISLERQLEAVPRCFSILFALWVTVSKHIRPGPRAASAVEHKLRAPDILIAFSQSSPVPVNSAFTECLAD